MQVQTRKVKKLPDILAFNCGMEHAKEVNVWKMQQQVRRRVHISLQPTLSQLFCSPYFLWKGTESSED